jgi:hypothetical protein
VALDVEVSALADDLPELGGLALELVPEGVEEPDGLVLVGLLAERGQLLRVIRTAQLDRHLSSLLLNQIKTALLSWPQTNQNKL